MIMNELEIVALLKRLVEEGQSLRAVAEELGLPPGHLSEFVNNKRRINRKTIVILGFDPTPYYVREKR